MRRVLTLKFPEIDVEPRGRNGMKSVEKSRRQSVTGIVFGQGSTLHLLCVEPGKNKLEGGLLKIFT
jgi:hypothetical protein